MKQITGSICTMLIMLFLAMHGFSQNKKMTWTTKSKQAKELALSGSSHLMNAEAEQAFTDFSAALKLDPAFTVALVFMSNLTRGEARKMYTERALKSAANKTEGEKLFVTLVNEKNTQDQNRDIWAKLHSMFPDGDMIGDRYVQTRATPEERFAAAQEYIAKFPKQPAMYNTIAYYYMLDKKDNDMAKKNLEKYIALYPNGANPYDSMGEFYLNTGDMENSKKYYAMALDRYPFLYSSLTALQKIADKDKNSQAKQ